MNEDIDIVIPWLNPTEKWYAEYKKYNVNELACRIRDLNTIKPAINGILKYTPWIRYIWLVVYDEEQIPHDWKELQNEKIKFVFHKDIIPKEFLPTFNSLLIECFINRIDGLSENFIFANDDMIFTKSIPKEYYFKNNKSVHRRNSLRSFPKIFNCQYDYICQSTSKFIGSIIGKQLWGSWGHMPIPIKKSMLDFLWYKYANKIYEICKNSRIRQKYNIDIMVAVFLLEEINKLCLYDNNISIKIKMVTLTDKTTKNDLLNAIINNHIICLNDGEYLVKNDKLIANYIKEIFN